MRKIYFFTLLFISVVLASCSKTIEDALTGSWKLDNAWKKSGFKRESFTTGYENGLFSFLESGDALYIDGQDTLTGYWRTNRRTSNVDGSTTSTRVFEINLLNFRLNKRLEWEFEDFDFKNNRQKIKAEDRLIEITRIYEFNRQ